MSAKPKRAGRVIYENLSATVDAAGWSAWISPKPDGYRLSCCGCGLVHNVNFRVRRRMAEVQFQINRRATKATRRAKRFAKIRNFL
jgi:hypothetical protein